jgi:hypothetical protein
MTPNLSTFRSLLRGLLIPVVGALGIAGSGFGQSSLVANSPFSPNGAASAGAGAPAEAYELAGSSIEGSDMSVCIFERQAKHSQWIPVGGDVDGVRVVSYDPANDTAVVMIGGSRKELSMRKAAVAVLNPPSSNRTPQVVSTPAPVSAPIAAAPPEAVGSAAREQREARMLVSDLLEIGIQQRKAYQEAKQKAAVATPPSPDN